MQLSFVTYVALGWVLAVTATVDTSNDDLCLNGTRDASGTCVCNPGYSEFRGRCYLSKPVVESEVENMQRSPYSYCPPGSGCAPAVCTGTLCGSSCPPGYVLQAGFCVISSPQCPTGTLYRNGFCYSYVPPLTRVEVVEPLKVDIPIPPLPEGSLEEDSTAPDIEVVPTRRPLRPRPKPKPVEKVVNNVNTYTAPTNVSTHNENNVFIHITHSRKNGAVKTVVIRNNETTIYEDQPKLPPKKPTPPIDDEVELLETEVMERPANRCCIIVSPRICRKQEHDEWVCFHRKHYRCGSFCTAEVVYLRPRRPLYSNSVLIMPPSYETALRYGQCRWGVCPPIDCSGCLFGKYRCHYKCYTYDCAALQGGEGCNFMNQDDYCGDNSDELCESGQ
uniref:Putative conserved secreted protein n=1 Tax=Culex tarsalis TaxID=7177 RepID=A0A1Q3FMY8_CULTA